MVCLLVYLSRQHIVNCHKQTQKKRLEKKHIRRTVTTRSPALLWRRSLSLGSSRRGTLVEFIDESQPPSWRSWKPSRKTDSFERTRSSVELSRVASMYHISPLTFLLHFLSFEVVILRKCFGTHSSVIKNFLVRGPGKKKGKTLPPYNFKF